MTLIFLVVLILNSKLAADKMFQNQCNGNTSRKGMWYAKNTLFEVWVRHLKFKKLRSRKLHDINCPRNIFWVVRGRRMRWVWHMACMEEERNVYRLFVRKHEVMLPFGKLGVDEKIQLIWIFNIMWVCGLYYSGSGWGQVVGLCKCGSLLARWGTFSFWRKSCTELGR